MGGLENSQFVRKKSDRGQNRRDGAVEQGEKKNASGAMGKNTEKG